MIPQGQSVCPFSSCVVLSGNHAAMSRVKLRPLLVDLERTEAIEGDEQSYQALCSRSNTANASQRLS
jgi:hypothetical protein